MASPVIEATDGLAEPFLLPSAATTGVFGLLEAAGLTSFLGAELPLSMISYDYRPKLYISRLLCK